MRLAIQDNYGHYFKEFIQQDGEGNYPCPVFTTALEDAFTSDSMAEVQAYEQYFNSHARYNRICIVLAV